MTLSNRLKKIETVAGLNPAAQPNCIYLCAMSQDPQGLPDPQVAMLMRGKLHDSTLDAFVFINHYNPSLIHGNRIHWTTFFAGTC